MNTLRLRLMYREALQRLDDAETLRNAIGFDSRQDSAYLLELLGLELLIKLIHEVALQKKPSYWHAYEKIFQALPTHFQERLLKLANERIGPSGLSSNAALIMKEWGENFVALRYPYERYDSLNEEQYAAIGEQWIANGAPIEEARFRFHPEELFGMLHALRMVAEDMANQSFQPSDFGRS